MIQETKNEKGKEEKEETMISREEYILQVLAIMLK